MLVGYSNALFDISLEKKNLQTVKEQFDIIVELVKNNEDLNKLFKAKNIEKSAKIDFMDKVFNSFDRDLVHFLKVLVNNNRLTDIIEINKLFTKQYQKKNNIKSFEIYSARKLNDFEIEKIRIELKKIFQTEVEINDIVDINLIGGIKISSNGRAFDNTLINQLEILKTILI